MGMSQSRESKDQETNTNEAVSELLDGLPEDFFDPLINHVDDFLPEQKEDNPRLDLSDPKYQNLPKYFDSGHMLVKWPNSPIYQTNCALSFDYMVFKVETYDYFSRWDIEKICLDVRDITAWAHSYWFPPDNPKNEKPDGMKFSFHIRQRFGDPYRPSVLRVHWVFYCLGMQHCCHTYPMLPFLVKTMEAKKKIAITPKEFHDNLRITLPHSYKSIREDFRYGNGNRARSARRNKYHFVEVCVYYKRDGCPYKFIKELHQYIQQALKWEFHITDFPRYKEQFILIILTYEAQMPFGLYNFHYRMEFRDQYVDSFPRDYKEYVRPKPHVREFFHQYFYESDVYVKFPVGHIPENYPVKIVAPQNVHYRQCMDGIMRTCNKFDDEDFILPVYYTRKQYLDDPEYPVISYHNVIVEDSPFYYGNRKKSHTECVLHSSQQSQSSQSSCMTKFSYKK